MEDEVVLFKVEGPIMRDPYPLHDIISISNDFHSIIDQAYLVLAGKNRMSRSERINYQILASHPRPGSYVQELIIVCAAALPLFGDTLPQITAPYVWQSAKKAFEFLKTVVNLRRDGKEFKISAPNNEGNVAVIYPGSPPVTLHQTIIKIAEKSEDHYKSITNQIEENRIESISAVDKAKEGILLTTNEKKLFNPEVKIENKPVDLIVNIFDFNKEKLSGKLRVEESQTIPAHDYNFNLIGNQDHIPYILAMTKSKVKFHCLLEKEIHTTGSEGISRLQAISIEEV